MRVTHREPPASGVLAALAGRGEFGGERRALGALAGQCTLGPIGSGLGAFRRPDRSPGEFLLGLGHLGAAEGLGCLQLCLGGRLLHFADGRPGIGLHALSVGAGLAFCLGGLLAGGIGG